MSAVLESFEHFAAQTSQGSPGVFYNVRRQDLPDAFYGGVGSYELVSFDTPKYPKFVTTSWDGLSSFGYHFSDNFNHLDLPSSQNKIDFGALESLEYELDTSRGSDWQDKVESAIKKQKAGEAWVINIAHDYLNGCFEDRREFILQLLKLFYSFLQVDRDHTAGIVITNEQIICSMSPEMFITERDNQLITEPIKGTGDLDYLENSTKEIAELDMITDLMRNDLGQICHDVQVLDRRSLVREKNFYSARSKVVGQLATQLSEADFKCLLPAGSISGAPKRRVVEIIEELEEFERGFYTGTLGVQLGSGHSIYNIMIRTIFADLRDKTWSYPVGVGITADSGPHR